MQVLAFFHVFSHIPAIISVIYFFSREARMVYGSFPGRFASAVMPDPDRVIITLVNFVCHSYSEKCWQKREVDRFTFIEPSYISSRININGLCALRNDNELLVHVPCSSNALPSNFTGTLVRIECVLSLVQHKYAVSSAGEKSCKLFCVKYSLFI